MAGVTGAKTEINQAEALGTGRGKTMAEREASMPKAAAALRYVTDKHDFVGGKIDEATMQANGLTTGFTGSVLSAVPGSDAYDLSRTLATIKANAGFDKLQEIVDKWEGIKE